MRLKFIFIVIVINFFSIAGIGNKVKVTLWHSYRGREELALYHVINEINKNNVEYEIVPLSIPYESYANKLTNAIPRRNGPDLFIFAHERIGSWATSNIILPLEDKIPKELLTQFFPQTVIPLKFKGVLYGLPLNFKSVLLFYNKKLVPKPPITTNEMIELGKKITDPHKKIYGIVYETGSFYHHAPWLFGFGGKIFDLKGEVVIYSPENVRSYQFVHDLVRKHKICPEEVNNVLVAQLFNEGKAAMVINGPWFLGEIREGIDFGVSTLPIVSETSHRAKPFLTIEALFLANHYKAGKYAIQAMIELVGKNSAYIRAKEGRQAVSVKDTWELEDIKSDRILSVFKEQLQYTVPMSSDPKMTLVWEPAQLALRQVLRGSAVPEEALKKAQFYFKVINKPIPKKVSPLPYLTVAILLLISVLIWFIKSKNWKEISLQIKENRFAYLYIFPSALSIFVLVLIPFLVGTCVSFFAHHEGKFTFIGLKNFLDIIFARDFPPYDPLSFYFTLGVTVLWTTLNLILHVTIGVILAVLLRGVFEPLRTIYRVILILPWAIPNYITALIWKGMFHRQFGAINAILAWLGIEPINWFSNFWTALSANVATNAWLGFPFMMVVTLGALQSIPKEIEEAAMIDGAGKITIFFKIILPNLKPALIPAVVLGAVWTFNMFNIIYLVSGGEPDGSTEILISEAYKWAFVRQEQYGYAAAYATLIFIVLFLYTKITRRLTEGR